MIEMGVDAAIGDESDEVEAFASGGRDRLPEDLVFGEGTVADGEVDASEFLIDDTAGTEVEVADLGISHLTLGEANLETAGLESAPRIIPVQTIMDRGFCEEGGIALLFRAGATGGIDPPTITN